jgi:hypothetical protein
MNTQEIEALLTIPNLYAWLKRQKSPNRRYSCVCGCCLLTRYLKTNGVNISNVGPAFGYTTEGVYFSIPRELDRISNRCWEIGTTHQNAHERASHRTYGNAIKYIERHYRGHIRQIKEETLHDKLEKLMTVENLKAWLLTQNPRTDYSYIDGRSCLLSRFLMAHGHKFYVDSQTVRTVVNAPMHKENFTYPKILDKISNNALGHTYGNALLLLTYPQLREKYS